MIYDCFTFFNELDILELRLSIMNDYVDRFVLVEATRTQKNKEKILYFQENKDRFKPFLHKITHIILDTFPEDIKPWTIENLQRNTIIQGLNNCKDDDIIIISDLDEIPRPEYIKKYYNPNRITAFDLDVFFFYLNNYCHNLPWTHGPKILSYYSLRNILNNEPDKSVYGVEPAVNKGTTPSKIRLYYGPKQVHIHNAGWHFTYMDKVNTVQKMHAVVEGKDEFDENDYDYYKKQNILYDWEIAPVVLDNTFPKYLRKNTGKYEKYIIKKAKNNIRILKLKRKIADLKPHLLKYKEKLDNTHEIIKITFG